MGGAARPIPPLPQLSRTDERETRCATTLRKVSKKASGIAGATSGVLRYLAGGTDVLVQLRAGMVQPDDLIDLKHIPGVAEIAATKDGGWQIGVAVPGIVLGGHAGVTRDWPGVVEGMELIGSTQVQGRATLVGNLCNGSPAADGVPALVAAGATVTVAGAAAAPREVAVADIPAGPGKTVLKKGEVISAVTLPPRGKHTAATPICGSFRARRWILRWSAAR